MLRSYWRFPNAPHIALLSFLIPFLLSAHTFTARAEVLWDFFQFQSSMGTGLSAPIVSSFPQIPLSQGLTMQPVSPRQPPPVSGNYVNVFGPSGGLATGSAGPMPNMTCRNNICQLAPPTPPPAVQHNQQSYQQYYYPHGATFSAPAPPPLQPRHR
jgi:hypothetical protein